VFVDTNPLKSRQLHAVRLETGARFSAELPAVLSEKFVIFRRLRKIAKSNLYLSCLSVRPSFPSSVRSPSRMEQLGFHKAGFDEIWYLSFSKICREN
jgi:hypothetical protein